MTPTEELPLVTVLTLNYNGRRFLPGLFDTLRQCSYPHLEIIMADNASSDDSVAFVRKHYPEINILKNAENYFFARGNNEGLKIAAGKYICVLNNDVEVSPDFIEPIVDAFEFDNHLGAVQPKILAMQKRDHLEYSGACGGFLDWLGYPFVRGRIFRTIEKDAGQYEDPLGVFWASGACIFIRKTALDDVTGFDEAFNMHMEEIDLCWRMRLQGWDIMVQPKSRIWHYVGGTLNQDNPRKMYWNYRNNLFMLIKNLSIFNLVIRLPLRVPLDLLALLQELFKGNTANSAAIFRAYSWVLFHLPQVWRKRRQVQATRRVGDREIMKRVYPGSIVFEYFLLRKKTFSTLMFVDSLLSRSRIAINPNRNRGNNNASTSQAVSVFI